jgi:hypothetical protein
MTFSYNSNRHMMSSMPDRERFMLSVNSAILSKRGGNEERFSEIDLFDSCTCGGSCLVTLFVLSRAILTSFSARAAVVSSLDRQVLAADPFPGTVHPAC